MKFSDLDKTLTTEAEAFDKKQGKLNRMGTKLKSKIAPKKATRQKAAGKAEIQQQALDIKDELMGWLGQNDLDATVSAVKQFLSDNNYQNLAAKVDEVAAKLNFKDEPQDDEDLTVASPPSEDEDPDATGDKSKKVAAPEKEAELELEPEEEEVEEEVDMSASIYESRLAYFLMEEFKLKDNQLDTLLVRVLQAAGAGGKKSPASDTEQPKAEPEKKDSLLKKAGKAYNKGMSKAFGDLHNRDSGGDDGGGSGYSGSSDDLNTRQSKVVKNILQTVLDGKQLSTDQTKVAKDLLREL